MNGFCVSAGYWNTYVECSILGRAIPLVMSQRENLSTGIYAALSALVVFICLIGAFVLPPSLVSGKWLGIAALVGFLVGIPVLLKLAHRSRIRDAVQKHGGSVVRIKKLRFWDQPYITYSFFLGTRYQVDYVDLMGIKHRAICKSGFFQGVELEKDGVLNEL
jgi:hypothetical protein